MAAAAAAAAASIVIHTNETVVDKPSPNKKRAIDTEQAPGDDEVLACAMEDQLFVSELALDECKKRIGALEEAVQKKDMEIAKLEGELYCARYNREMYYKEHPPPMDSREAEAEEGRKKTGGGVLNVPPERRYDLPPLPELARESHPDHDVLFADVDKCQDWVLRNVTWLPKEHRAEIFIPKGATDRDLLQLLIRLYVCDRARHEKYRHNFDEISKYFFYLNQAQLHAGSIQMCHHY